MPFPGPVMRMTPGVACIVSLAMAAACGGTTDGTPNGPGPTASQAFELGRALEDDILDQIAGATMAAPGLPAGMAAPATCPDSSSTADGDGDHILTNSLLTYADPPCSLPGPGGVWTVTGKLRVQDASGGTSQSYGLTYTGLATSFADSADTADYVSTRDGVRGRTGNGKAAQVISDIIVARSRPGRATAQVGFQTTLIVDASPASMPMLQPVPDGAAAIVGDMVWQRSSEHWTFTVATPVALTWDKDCAAWPRRITAGTVRLTGTIDGEHGTLGVNWTGCGTPLALTWTAGP